MSHALSRTDWEEMWAELKAYKHLPLSEYVKETTRVKNEWRTKYGLSNASLSNSRYVAHIEDCLRIGWTVPTEFIESINPAVDMRYDRPAFPLLNERLAKAEGGV